MKYHNPAPLVSRAIRRQFTKLYRRPSFEWIFPKKCDAQFPEHTHKIASFTNNKFTQPVIPTFLGQMSPEINSERCIVCITSCRLYDPLASSRGPAVTNIGLSFGRADDRRSRRRGFKIFKTLGKSGWVNRNHSNFMIVIGESLMLDK